jgi:hypothetical protein
LIGLKDFVREALVQIATGVGEAQKALAGSKAKVNPPLSGDTGGLDGTYQVSHRSVAHLVAFDVPVSDADGELVVGPASQAGSEGTSRLHFKVGVAFPVDENKGPEGSQFELED